MNESQRVLGERIQTLRKKLGITQQTLAEQAGLVAHQIVSQIENGYREVKAWELLGIAEALKTDVHTLLVPSEPDGRIVLVWRCQDGDIAVEEAAFVSRCKRYHQLEEWLEMEPPRELPQVDIDARSATVDDVQRIALDISRTLNLGSIPAASLSSVLENDYSVKVWYEDLGTNGSAASAFGEFGYGIVMHRLQPPWRRNFSFGHELFHLITRDSISPQEAATDSDLHERAEKLAERFAGMLLLPVDALGPEFDARRRRGRVTYTDAVEMARRFGVSTEALLWGLVSCGRITADDARKALADPAFRKRDRMSMSSHWWQPPSMPERFVRLALLAYQKGKMSRGRLAEYLEVSLLNLPDTLAEYGLEMTEDLEDDVFPA